MSLTIENFGSITEEKLIDLIRVSETTERYSDMCKYIKALVLFRTSSGKNLNVEERNLLSVAYKNVVGSKRAAYRILSGGFEDTDESLIDKLQSIIEDELELICKEVKLYFIFIYCSSVCVVDEQVLALLKDNLLKDESRLENEVLVFYLKMVGDYYRYLCEFRKDNNDFKNESKNYYLKAYNIAKEHLTETHPTRLGLALNFSVCYYEILNESSKACELAKNAFDVAIEKLDTIGEQNYKDATLIMQLLRDNLTLWTSETQEED